MALAITNISIRQALNAGAEQLSVTSQSARRDAELLLMRTLQCDRAFLLTHPETPLSASQAALYEQWLRRRATHEPIQYITGEQEFFGLRFEVTPDVLIPRPETEHLVEALLTRVPRDTPLRIADVGTGSGAIAVALAHSLPHAKITALDVSSAALHIGQKNAVANGVADQIRFLESDLLAAVDGEQFDVIVSNPPYVAESEVLEAQVRDYEPWTALFSGPTGLEVYQRLIPQAETALMKGGWLFLEIGQGQQPALVNLLARWQEVSFVPDLQGIPRVACARHNELD